MMSSSQSEHLQIQSEGPTVCIRKRELDKLVAEVERLRGVLKMIAAPGLWVKRGDEAEVARGALEASPEIDRGE